VLQHRVEWRSADLGDQRVGELALCSTGHGELLAQLAAEVAESFDAGDDEVLFCVRRARAW